MRLPQRLFWFVSTFVLIVWFGSLAALGADVRFKITLPGGYPHPVTGRVFIMISKTDNPEPRLQVGSWRSHVQFLGRDVQGLEPGQAFYVDALTMGYPMKSVR